MTASRSAGASPVTMLFHPTFLTSDRDRLAAFFERVFGVPSDRQGELADNPDYGVDPDYSSDYSLYTWIGDVWFDAIQPDLYAFASPSLCAGADRLSEIGWIVDDAAAAYRSCRKAGIRLLDQQGRFIADEAQLSAGSAVSSDVNLFWLSTEDAGMSVELTYISPAFTPGFANAFKFWPLVEGGFPQRPGAIGPLGIIRGDRHSFLTADLDRAANLMVAAFGGTKLADRIDPKSGACCMTFDLAGTKVEYIQPAAGDARQAALADPPYGLSGKRQRDIYWSISFVVADLDRARRHLIASGIALEHDEPDLIMTDPADCLGMRWGFTSGGSAQ
jgi:catechol 2,3-dioxygenase-like lactoylglutathione lyase family enzyme